MDTQPQPAIAWYYRHHAFSAVTEDSIEDALDYLYYGEDAGDLSATGVETTGGFISGWRQHPHVAERERREQEARGRQAKAPQPQAILFIQAPPDIGIDGKWITLTSGKADDLQREADELAAIIGEDRVKVKTRG